MYIQLIKEQIYFNTNILFMHLLNYSKNNVYLNIYIYIHIFRAYELQKIF